MTTPPAPDPLAALASGGHVAPSARWRLGEAGEAWRRLAAEPHALKCGCHPREYDSMNECVGALDCGGNNAELAPIKHPDGFYRDPRCTLPTAVIDRIRACGGLAAYVRDLEAALGAAGHALEGSQQFMLSTVAALGLPASDVPAATRSLMFEVAHTRAQVRALAPPERSRVAAPAEDAREADR